MNDVSKSLHKIGFMEYIKRLARMRLVKHLSRTRRRQASVRIACFPGDDIGDNIISHGWYEDLLLKAIFDGLFADQADRFEGGLALDIGANIGNHSLWLAKRFSRVLSFEPNPVCIKLFEANMLMNGADNVRLFQLGLSDQDTTLNFHSGRAVNLGRSGVSDYLADGASCSFPVRVTTGDSLLSQETRGDLSVMLAKIDVEGHELLAIRGLKQTFLRFKPLVLFESHGATGEFGSDAIVNDLRGMGYSNFYVIETNRIRSKSRFRKVLHRLVRGFELTVKKVDRLEDRSYSLIIAAAEPLRI